MGDNNLLKSHIVTGLPINDIIEHVNNGVTINEDGTLEGINYGYTNGKNNKTLNFNYLYIFLMVSMIIAVGYYISRRKKNKQISLLTNTLETDLKTEDKGGDENEKDNY